jgi:hypothetical protein
MTEKYFEDDFVTEPKVIYEVSLPEGIEYRIYEIGSIFQLQIEKEWEYGYEQWFFESKDKLKGFLAGWNEFTKTIEI